MPAQLVALNDGLSILVDKPILLLGRHPECDIQIDSRKVSRRHCCIAQVDDYLVVRDLDSTNGIRINGERVVEGKLHPGDELTIGGSRYRVSWDGAVQPAVAPRAWPASPLQVPEDDDEHLERCDDPVPLAETRRPRRTPRPATYSAPPPPPRKLAEEDSVVLPSDMDLLSGSSPPSHDPPPGGG